MWQLAKLQEAEHLVDPHFLVLLDGIDARLRAANTKSAALDGSWIVLLARSCCIALTANL